MTRLAAALLIAGFIVCVSGAYLSENGRTQREQLAGLLGLILGAFLGIAGLALAVAALASRPIP